MHLRFSQDLQALLTRLDQEALTLGGLLMETAERGFSLGILLLVLPFLLPMPPGAAGVFGAACALLGLQMLLGRRSPWLPARIARYEFPKGLVRPLLRVLQGMSGILEQLLRPRLQRITRHPYFWRLNGLCIAWLAFLLMLPIPFTNPIPTLVIILIAIATLESDGFLLCLAYGLAIVVTGLFISLGYGLLHLPELIQGVAG